MSAYENYDRSSRHYDHTRVPVGGEIILGCLAGQRKALHELVVLDAGCGTGAYTCAIVDHVGRVAAIDMSRGMVEVARAKLRDQAAAARVGFLRGSIAALPFAAESVDAVMINQVHSMDFNAFAAGLAGGNPDPALLTVGETYRCQAWGRDQGFPPPNNTALSNALEVPIGP